MDNQAKLALLRVQLFTAMQTLTGDDLTAFWNLIADVSICRSLYPAPQPSRRDGTADQAHLHR